MLNQSVCLNLLLVLYTSISEWMKLPSSIPCLLRGSLAGINNVVKSNENAHHHCISVFLLNVLLENYIIILQLTLQYINPALLLKTSVYFVSVSSVVQDSDHADILQ
jgi:hypothetical protein